MHGMEDMAALEVLKEIKSLMDSRLGDKLAPKEASVEVEIQPAGEEMPEEGMGEDMGMLEEIRKKMVE